MNRILIWLARVFVVTMLCSGCAFGSRNVNLMYEPVSSASPRSKGRIAVSRFKDMRTSELAVGQQVGQVRNGFGMPTAMVNANQNPVIWVADSLARGLAAQGFAVERIDSPASAGDLPLIAGSVTQVFADVAMVLEAEVKADVSVERGGQQLTKTECLGRDSKMAWTGSADEYQDRINAAMRQFVDACIATLLPYLDARP
jgi:hypothetical protein